MAIELIPNQLVKLYDTETFNQRNKRLTQDGRTYCQIVRTEQTTQFQVKTTPINGANLVTNGEFESDISSWVQAQPFWYWYNGNAVGLVSNAALNPTLFQQITVEQNTWYKFSFEIIQIGGGQIQVSAADTGLNIIESTIIDRATYGEFPGQFSIYFDSGNRTQVNLVFAFDADLAKTVLLDNVSVEKVTTPTVTLEDCDGNLIETLSPFARALDRITYEVNWFGKAEDTCYRICMTGVDDLDKNYLENALALATEGDEVIELEQGGNLNWF